MPSVKHVAKTAGLGVGLYIATFLGSFLVLALVASAFGDGLLSAAIGGAAIGWLCGPPFPGHDLPAIEYITAIAWQVITIAIAFFVSRRLCRAAKRPWLLSIPVYITLIFLFGLLAALLGAGTSGYDPLGSMRF